MSKMPAKKKSCFQITSVTQAQVAASSATDDTESLDDPDESRTEDVSSEIFDVSRADYEPVCDRSSSEETLNNVGEPEAPGAMAPPHIPQLGQLSALSSNPGGGFRKVGVAGSTQSSQQVLGTGAATSLTPITQPGAVQQLHTPAVVGGPTSVSVNVSQPAPVASSTPSSSTTSTVSCSSRFRVIKLDHGTGEPFRRGRWTCTEFYERDSEGSVVSRTVDSIRHANATADPSTDRDSGLGHTGGSVIAPATHSGQGLGSLADTSLSASRMHSLETLQQQQQQQQQQQIHHQNFCAGTQGVSGTSTQNAFSSSKPIIVSTQQQQQPTVGGLQPSASQNLLPVGHNGLPQGSNNLQKSPIMPPAAQPIAYPPQQQQQPMLQQLPLGHHLTSQSSGFLQNQTEYYQQQQPASMQPGVSTGQSLTVTSLSAVGQGPSPVMTPATGGASLPSQGGEMAGGLGGSLPAGQTVPGLLRQQTGGGIGGVGGSMPVGGSTLQQAVGQYATSGQPQPHGLHPTPSGVQNVPAVAVSSSVPTTVPAAVPSASSAAMPNLTTSSLPPGQPSQLPCSNAGGLGAQGLLAAGFGQVEAGSGRKSEGLANTQPLVVSGKDLMKPLIPESLQLATPTVNSLFGIPIPVDGDEDSWHRNPSKAFYQAFQSGSRLRDSKAHSDSASGTSVVAIDNKIEQAMDLVKSHLMYAVREEVEVLKEQIKELYERNSVLERENAVLKSLANSDQLSQLPIQSATGSSSTPPQQGLSQAQPLPQLQLQALPQSQPQLQLQIQPPPQSHPQLQHHPKPQQLQSQPQLDPSQQLQPNVTSA